MVTYARLVYYSLLLFYTEYQPNGRASHTSQIVGNKLYIRSGWQKDYPRIHNGEEKRRYNSSVEIFNLITGNWSQYPTTGNPPLAINGYPSAVIDNNIIYFRGFCGHKGCYHNSLTSLCIDTLHWKELPPTNPNSAWSHDEDE